MDSEKNYKSWPRTWPKHLDYPKIKAHHFLEQHGEGEPDRELLVFRRKSLTIGQLNRLANCFAALLVSIGVNKGERVAIHLPNSFPFAIGYFGILKAGAVYVPVSPMLSPKEAAYQLRDAGAVVLLTLDGIEDKLLQAVKATSVSTIITTSLEIDPGEIPVAATRLERPVSGAQIQLKAYLHYGIEQAPDVQIDVENDLAHIAYTGGTTGRSKGVMLTHFNIVSNVLQGSLWAMGAKLDSTDGRYSIAFPEGIDPKKERITDGYGETVLMVAPWFHAMGIIQLCNQVFQKNKAIILQRFDADEYLDAIERYRVSILTGAPQLFNTLMSHPKFQMTDFSSIKLINSGAAPLPMALLSRMRESFQSVIVEGYGLTECCQLAATSPPDPDLFRPGSIGLPVYDTELRIIDLDDGSLQEPFQEGEICIKGPQVMKGYWNQPVETGAVLIDGWLHTGDIGYMDRDGYFFITDRMKDMIIYKGYNVYPRELEEILQHHPAVSICAVVGALDEKAGEIPVAYVQLAENAQVDQESLMTYVNEQVAYYKKIRDLIFIDEMPMSGPGKVLKRKLKEKYAEKL